MTGWIGSYVCCRVMIPSLRPLLLDMELWRALNLVLFCVRTAWKHMPVCLCICLRRVVAVVVHGRADCLRTDT